MLLISMMTQAQSLKVTPKMAKGDVKNYVCANEISAAGTNVKMNFETKCTVTEESATGYVIDCKVSNYSSDAAANNMIAHMLTISSEVMNNINTRVITDKDGKPTGIKNLDEVMKNIKTSANKIAEELIKSVPQAADVLTKEQLVEQLMAEMSEDALLKKYDTPTSLFVLNGKTIMTGAQDEYIDNGMKMKRMYFQSGKDKITTTASMNMSGEELKKMVIEKVMETAPDQAEMIKQNIDAVMASGMLKFSATEKTNYELSADGWVKSIQSESEADSMGQKVIGKTTITLK